jgi:hypothetical protein
MNHAVQTAHPHLVETDDSVTFWCWYNLETNYDVAVLEVSENTKEWFNLDTTRFNGNSNGWTRRAYSLEDWLGKSVYIRFRAMTDGSVLEDGIYVDDIYPTCQFINVDTVSSNIPDTLYDFVGHPSGEYYYMVRGYNSAWGWGDYSCLAPVEVLTGIKEGEVTRPTNSYPSISLRHNPFANRLHINYTFGGLDPEAVRLTVYDATGRIVRDLSQQVSVLPHRSSVVWDGYDDSGRSVPSGIYFVHFDTGTDNIVEKAILLR